MTFKINKKRNWGIILILQFFLFYGFSKSKNITSIFIHFFEWKKLIHQKAFSSFQYSFGDISYIVIALILVILITSLFFSCLRKKAAFYLLIIINIFYFSYQLLWGSLYFEPPIIEKLPKEKISLKKTKQLYEFYIEECNDLREKVNEDENGIFCINDITKLKKEIIIQQKELPKELNSKIPYPIISIKPSYWGQIMNKTGILGYYNPFTAEAQYNPNIPNTLLSFTIAHETAHQLGYAREYEASFIGYLISEKTSNMDIKYSTSLFVLKSLARYISSKDKEYINEKNNISVKVLRDLEYERKFREINYSYIKEIFINSNDLFLKSNQQKGRVSYSYFIELFLRYKNKKEPH